MGCNPPPPRFRSEPAVRTGRIPDAARASPLSAAPPRVNRALAVSLVALMVALLSLLTALFAAFAPDVGTAGQRQTEREGRRASDEAALLEHMVLMQRYVEKAALAADAGNRPLAAFYAQKISERATRVIDGGYVIDGTDVSAIAAEVADPRATALVRAAESGDRAQFDAAYGQMVMGCNTCHRLSGYGLVEIRRPDADVYPSQVFSRTPAASGP